MSGVVPPLHPVPLWHAHGLYLTVLVGSVIVVEVSKLKQYSVKMQEVFYCVTKHGRCRGSIIMYAACLFTYSLTYLLTYLIVYLFTYLITYLFTYLLHRAESFSRS